MRKYMVIFVSLVLSRVSAETISGKLYKIGSQRQELLYLFQNKISNKGGVRTANSEYATPDKKTVITEYSLIKNGKPQLYEINHQQLGKKGRIEISDTTVYFTRTDGDKVKTDAEKLTGNFVFPHSLVIYVQSKWADLQAGKDVNIRMAVWDRLETVGMSLQKISEIEINGNKAIKIKMKPTSFIIAALVEPLIFHFAVDTHDLLEMQGRVPPRFKSGDTWKDLDADVVYTQENK